MGNFGESVSAFITVAGIIVAALAYVFSVSSNVNKSILIATKEKKKKLFAFMVVIFIVFGYIIAREFDFLFDVSVLIIKTSLVIVLLIILLNVKSFYFKTTNKFLISLVELFVLVALPLVEGIFIFPLIESLFEKIAYDNFLLLIGDVVSWVLVIGILYFRISEQQELYEITLIKGITLYNTKDDENESVHLIGQLISESDSFYDIKIFKIKDDILEKQEQVCINKSNISHFKQSEDLKLELVVKVTKNKDKK